MGRRQERTGRRPAPLPVRDGLNPSRVRLPEAGPWVTALECLLARFHPERTRLLEKVAAREVVDEDGIPVDAEMPFRADTFIYLYRDPAPEPRVPFEVDVLFRDEHLLVADKPHFLSSLPNGSYIVESAVVRLRRALDLPDLSPLHRLDRITAGVLLFSLRPQERGAYQSMFARREVRKSYVAIAPHDPALALPRTVRSRIVKDRGTPTAYETSGEPNSETLVTLEEVRDGWGRYRLVPATGKTHQLRVHMNSLGIPIRNDPFYPRMLDVPFDDYRSPLQLLAEAVAFKDPVTGEERSFVSRRELACWPWTSEISAHRTSGHVAAWPSAGGPRNVGEAAPVAAGMSELTVYTTSWCPFCRRLVTDLDRAGIEFTDIDVDADADAAAIVQQLNNGNRTVPTVVFADGSSLTNPPIAQVQAKLAG